MALTAGVSVCVWGGGGVRVAVAVTLTASVCVQLQLRIWQVLHARVYQLAVAVAVQYGSCTVAVAVQ